eukprot:TRINITY_DN4445_c0_g2_i1.p1 TRINITY_DN4445_c0_g2~~TRINITY_DN4445_c0_g2_i1.p1  ORF type:complete len:364 (-),score=97.35 TRINITY_DN4445_c0_g2_i1:49-1140(-)
MIKGEDGLFVRDRTLEDDYEIHQQLGKGNYSVVYAAENKKDHSNWAAKRITKKGVGQKGLDMILTEVKVLRAVDHPNIVTLKQAYETQAECNLVLELISGGELFDKIVELSSYSEKDASRIVRQMTSAIAHLHSKGIVHRDLKPENLLLESQDPQSAIRLADFGLSQFVSKSHLLNVAVGTPGYVAPEVVACLDSSKAFYGIEIDMWGIGVITFILLCGYPPFYSEDDDEVFDLIAEGNFEFAPSHWDDKSDSAKDLIRKLLVVDPQLRLTAEEALKHPWVKGGEATSEVLTGAITELRKFNAKKKWKGAILATMMMNRLGSKGKKLRLNSSMESSGSSPAVGRSLFERLKDAAKEENEEEEK